MLFLGNTEAFTQLWVCFLVNKGIVFRQKFVVRKKFLVKPTGHTPAPLKRGTPFIGRF